jgi:hypothetical protein
MNARENLRVKLGFRRVQSLANEIGLFSRVQTDISFPRNSGMPRLTSELTRRRAFIQPSQDHSSYKTRSRRASAGAGKKLGALRINKVYLCFPQSVAVKRCGLTNQAS